MSRSAPNQESDRALLGYGAVAGAALAWGTIGVAARAIFMAGLTPLDGATWRAVGAFSILLVYCLATHRGALRVARRDLALFAAYGAVSVAGFMTVYLTAIERTTIATAAVLLYTAPAWVVVLARVLFGESLTRMKLVAVLLTFAGSVLVAGAIGPGAVRLDAIGVLAGLCAGLTYGLYSIFGKIALRKYSPLTTVVYSLGFGALFLLVVSRGLPSVTSETLPALAYLIVIPTVVAYVLYTSGLRRVEAGRASIVATLEPVVAALAGTVILREPFTLIQWIGAGLVLSGVLLVQNERSLNRVRDPA
ncbi:MAG: DMT family transporter [bacterium]